MMASFRGCRSHLCISGSVKCSLPSSDRWRKSWRKVIMSAWISRLYFWLLLDSKQERRQRERSAGHPEDMNSIVFSGWDWRTISPFVRYRLRVKSFSSRPQVLCVRVCLFYSTMCLAGWPLSSEAARLRCGSDLLSDLIFVCGDRGIYLGKSIFMLSTCFAYKWKLWPYCGSSGEVRRSPTSLGCKSKQIFRYEQIRCSQDTEAVTSWS